ncbi:insulinase family protein [Candidatus Poribacteria bacterium]|nr:insulinase family protein [Candidatus Poribacteria bacterium]
MTPSLFPAARAGAVLLAALLLTACAILDPRNPPAPRQDTIHFQSGDDTVHLLPNQLTLIHRRTAANQIVAVTCLAQPGATADGDRKAGRTQLMAQLLTKGTARRSSNEIAEALAGMGAEVSASAAQDSVSVSLRCVRSDLEDAMDIYSDVLRNPVFPIEELRTERQRLLAQIRIRDDSSAQAAFKRFRRALFKNHPYGRPVEGEPETVAGLTQADVAEAHSFVFRPDRMIVAIVGDITFEDALELMTKHFGTMMPGGEELVTASKTFSPAGSREEFQRKVEQGFIALGTFAPAVDHADAPAVDVAAALLGQGMSSRLFSELRDKRGLAYSVGATAQNYLHGGFFATYIGTSPATLDQSLDGLWEQVSLLRDEPVRPEELDRAKAYLVGGYLRRHETNAQQAHFLAWWHATGLGIAHDREYPEKLKAVTTRDIMRVANKYFNDPAVVVLRAE